MILLSSVKGANMTAKLQAEAYEVSHYRSSSFLFLLNFLNIAISTDSSTSGQTQKAIAEDLLLTSSWLNRKSFP